MYKKIGEMENVLTIFEKDILGHFNNVKKVKILLTNSIGRTREY